MRLGPAVLVLLLGAALVAPLLPPYLATDRDVWKPAPELIVSLLPKPADWARASPTSATWAWTRRVVGEEFDPTAPAFHLFPGGFAAAGLLAGVGCVLARRTGRGRTMAAFTLAAALVAGFVLRVGDWSPYRGALGLPVADSLRAAFRVGLVLAFPLAAAAGLAVGRLAETVRNPAAHRLLAAAVLALLVYDVRSTDPASRRSGISRTPIAEMVARRERLADAARPFVTRDTILYVYPESDDLMSKLATQLDAMAAAQTLDVATINCWTGHVPSGWEPFNNSVSVERWLKSRGRDADEVMSRTLFVGASTGGALSPEELALRARLAPRTLTR